MSTHSASDDYPPIEDHGVIGDLRTTALVSLDGTIDFLCLPCFDSPSVFASLLDAERGGRFALGPAAPPARRQQMYLPQTNVLLTRSLAADGIAELVDFMPPGPEFETQAVIRLLRGVRGELRFRLLLDPSFDYARAEASVSRASEGVLVLAPKDGGDALRLRTPIEVEIVDHERGLRICAEFTLRAGQELAFVLESDAGDEQSPFSTLEAVKSALDRTELFWHDWSAKVQYHGRWSEAVLRSALTLKLLTSHETGAFVAAPTFSLPEYVGDVSNWDYRYCWIRDTAYAMKALSRLGLRDDAWALAQWLEERCCIVHHHAPFEAFYKVDGGHVTDEVELDSLAGYRGSQPVRIGNAAAQQLQLDIWGEFLDALYIHDPTGTSLPGPSWQAVIELLERLVESWSKPDHGIWELRGPTRERLHSRVLSWVAFDRGIRLAQGNGRPAPVERWRAARDQVHRSVREQFWDEQEGMFTGIAGQRSLDAASLVMPLHGFISAFDPSWQRMMSAVDEHLVEGSLVYRLALGPEQPEATFSLCTFWYVECLSQARQLSDARHVFETMLRYANHVGLYSEHLGPCGEHLGNFPQGLTHLGLINAALDLDARLDDAGRSCRGRV